MARPSKYTSELKSRAVRMVAESKGDFPSEFEAIRSIAMKLGIGSPEILRKWIRQGEIDDGVKPDKNREDIAEIKELKKENAELRRANSILKSASASSPRKLRIRTSDRVGLQSSTGAWLDVPSRWVR